MTKNDHDFDVIPLDDYLRDWLPIYEQVFTKDAGADFPAETPFADPAWQRVALAYELDFGGPTLDLGETIEDGYPKRVDLDDNQILFDTLAEFGIERFIATLTNPTQWTPTPNAYLCHTKHSSIYNAFRGLPARPVMLFSEDATWGAISTLDGDSILGGTDEFMVAYLKRAGGLEAVKLKFWIGDVGSDAYSELFHGDHTMLDQYYAMLGWEPPPRPWGDVYEDWDIRIAEIQKHARRLKEIMGWTDESLGIA